MPVGIAPTPSDAPVGQQKKGAAPSVAVIPFARSSKWHIEQSNVQSGIVLGAAAQVFNFPLASYGYLSAVLITCALTGGTASTALTFFEDAPYSLFSQVQLSDVNGVPIFQLSGFHAYLAAKWGGYRLFGGDGVTRGTPFDGTTPATFVGTANATLGGGPLANFAAAVTNPFGAYWVPPTATSANLRFMLPIWLEFGMDGLGCLPNMDASARYNLQITVAGGAQAASVTGPFVATATTYTGANVPTMTITVEILARSQPPAQDMFGNMNSVAPPAVGTVQYWTNQTASGLANGANTIQLTRVGNLIRNHILVFRNSTATQNPRATAENLDLPQLFEFDWDVGQRYVANVSTIRFANGYLVYGFDDPNGVLTLPNTLDPDKLPLSEYGDEWLGTVGATKLTLRFTTGAGGGSVSVLTNDIVPASGQIYQAPALVVM